MTRDDEYWQAEAAKQRKATAAAQRDRDEARAELGRLRAADQLKQALRELGIRDTTLSPRASNESTCRRFV